MMLYVRSVRVCTGTGWHPGKASVGTKKILIGLRTSQARAASDSLMFYMFPLKMCRSET